MKFSKEFYLLELRFSFLVERGNGNPLRNWKKSYWKKNGPQERADTFFIRKRHPKKTEVLHWSLPKDP